MINIGSGSVKRQDEAWSPISTKSLLVLFFGQRMSKKNIQYIQNVFMPGRDPIGGEKIFWMKGCKKRLINFGVEDRIQNFENDFLMRQS